MIDVRFVCATDHDPLIEVETGCFREDLYCRLHVIPIHLPSLHERNDDVLKIARRFLADFAAEESKGFKRFDDEVESIFHAYSGLATCARFRTWSGTSSCSTTQR